MGRSPRLAIADGESLPMAPQESLIATEDYLLSRRLFLYLKPGEEDPGPRPGTFRPGPAWPGDRHPQRLRRAEDPGGADRTAPADARRIPQARGTGAAPDGELPLQEGSALLDNKALLDVQRLLDYLRQNRKLQERTVLVGFGDPKSDAERSVLLSRLRAMAVRRERPAAA